MFKCNVIDFFETYEVVLMSHQKIHVDETPLVTLLDQASYHGNIEDYIGLKVTLKYPNLENVLTAVPISAWIFPLFQLYVLFSQW